MPTEVWISTSDHPDMSTLGPEWLHAGHLDSSRETELWKVVQAHLGLRNTPARPTVEFYVDLIVGSDGHHGLLNVLPEGRRDLNGSRMRTWLALRWGGPPERTLFATDQAELAPLRRRPPEPHPGLRPTPQPVGLRLTHGGGRFFTSAPAAAT